ncbi:molybdopterin biosynthesis protein MoeA [Aquitalea magnusonii]|uniref:Molybdopterin molybdenumtransferase n=1 Tax=Aquitalea magnusonii TaxID=332411 RepID=A0A3G9GFH9_9NEIS|nr:gephyrin-like molybdotransferase Glp [Aquitalea magnusonii]BBF85573.1 molybdopterin biosynthesis protein MoeA [Aquitalea magnusonii]
MLTVDQARDWLLQRAQPVRTSETLPLLQALGRILAEPVLAGVDVPPQDNSAMDGYALRCADGSGPLPVSQRIPAGTQPQPLQAGTAARIFTGAPIPAGADAVVMQEMAVLQADGQVLFSQAVKPGQNIRRAGEDILRGATVLSAGQLLTAADLGLAASIGVATLTVYRPLRVAVFFTGDELTEPGQPLAAGHIYNSNRYWLVPELMRLGCEVTDLGIVPDSLSRTREILQDAAGLADVIMTCGGVSVGEEDHVKAAVEAEGSLDLWKIAIKPGKPLASGKVGQAGFIGLPGNPVSGFVTYQVLVKPYLQRCAGLQQDDTQPVAHYPAGFAWERPDTRREEFLRVKLVQQDGRWQLQRYPNQGSGVLTSCAWADGLVRLAPGQQVSPGDMLALIAFAD